MVESIYWLYPNLAVPTWTDILTTVGIIIIGWLLQHYLMKLIVKKIANFFEKKSKIMTARVIEHFSREIRHAIFTVIIFLSLSYLIEVSLFSNRAVRNVFYSLMVFYFIKGMIDVLNYYANDPEAFHLDVKKSTRLTPFMLRVINALLAIIAIVLIASLWNFNLNGFLTGIGLTSVALAFGVRDTSSHIFGGLSMAFDKPFKVGDYIVSEDNNIEGVIEDINLRSTLISTPDQGTVYVPNAYLMNRPIYNLTAREKRKIQSYFYLSTEHPEEVIRSACNEVNKQIILHPLTSKEDLIMVYIDEFQADYYRMFVSYYIPSNELQERYEVQQDILFVIKQVMDRAAIKMVDPESFKLPKFNKEIIPS
ncbi:mechanosensitive ion channel protein MscS [Lysinibacillus yapensis]|uniref:Mechanosensitive ion channel protein MscS n=1 Tax=Ureibacillus yapensis TaxID=2304605 RepID=A0A396SI86_9BACL|nr:mechanosensitive ion channel domain-containing protein [Lysinibacillus yapensis]RHW32100.1 mechanosensitive ion channel protein MscS [Lysinibacillus yapensis]